MARVIPYIDTTVPASKSIAEIEDVLQTHHCDAVAKEFEDGRIKGVAFKVGGIPYRMPSRVDALYQYLLDEKTKKPRTSDYSWKQDKQRTLYDQAERVAWRNVMAWVKAQLALVEIGMVQVREVFMPYMLTDDGQTAFERWEAGALPALPLPPQ